MANKTAKWLVGIGVAIVILTHIYVLYAGLPEEIVSWHSWLNIIAGLMIVYGWMKR